MKYKKYHELLVRQLNESNRGLAEFAIESIGRTPTQGAIDRVIKIASKDSCMGMSRDLLAEIKASK